MDLGRLLSFQVRCWDEFGLALCLFDMKQNVRWCRFMEGQAMRQVFILVRWHLNKKKLTSLGMPLITNTKSLLWMKEAMKHPSQTHRRQKGEKIHPNSPHCQATPFSFLFTALP